jgi:predicted protein tyrosine phosphatase
MGHADYTGMALLVFGRYAAEQYMPESNDEVCISIHSRSPQSIDGRSAKLNGRFADVLEVVFDDTANEGFYEHAAHGLSEMEAEKIAQFVLNHRDKKKIVLHCYAGMNRSRSTAEAIARELQLPYAFTINNYDVFEKVTKALRKLKG